MDFFVCGLPSPLFYCHKDTLGPEDKVFQTLAGKVRTCANVDSHKPCWDETLCHAHSRSSKMVILASWHNSFRLLLTCQNRYCQLHVQSHAPAAPRKVLKRDASGQIKISKRNSLPSRHSHPDSLFWHSFWYNLEIYISIYYIHIYTLRHSIWHSFWHVLWHSI